MEPWFGLTTTNPPVWIGAIYCTLETLVRLATTAGGAARPRQLSDPRRAELKVRASNL